MHRLDASVDCNFEGLYLVFVIVAAGCMLLYPIGIPLVFSMLLFKNRHALSRDYSTEIDLQSFTHLAARVLPERTFTSKELKHKFHRLDRNRNDVISADEFSRFGMLQVLGEERRATAVRLGALGIATTVAALNTQKIAVSSQTGRCCCLCNER